MTVYVQTTDPALLNEAMDVVRIFYGAVKWQEGLPEEDGADSVSLCLTEEPGSASGVWRARASGMFSGEETACYQASPDRLEHKRRRKRAMKTAVYRLVRQAAGRRPPWGSLTGIRPTRLIYAQLDRGMTLDESCRYVGDTFDVSDDKLTLLKEIVETQLTLPAPQKGEAELYIGIPFCVSRCTYCSFLSGELGNGRLTGPYVDALLREIRYVLNLREEKGIRLSTVYVGGGTPTSLTAAQLERVLQAVAPAIRGREFTVEAGRPDTITREKLQVIRDAGVTRLSVNPQTAHDLTLERIGRRHTTAQTLEAYELARQMGFDDINMDIIAGLPGEDEAMFGETLAWVEKLRPDSLTVHSLAIKHASVLHLYGAPLPDGEKAAAMVDAGRESAHRMGMRAYYLYRQKYMAGNLENAAYARPGAECLYNVRMMEETGNVLALGAGGISKRVDLGHGRIERAPNVANIEEYISRVDEMCGRKRKLWEES